MPSISVFDMLKVGIGPSSSHTLGPWRAIQRWSEQDCPAPPEHLRVELHGSLALTGRGHATDLAILLALLAHDPITLDRAAIDAELAALRDRRTVLIQGRSVRFDPDQDLIFRGDTQLPQHPNGLRIIAETGGSETRWDYYSVGGGFVIGGADDTTRDASVTLPYPCAKAADLLQHCENEGLTIAELVRRNERTWRDDGSIDSALAQLWDVMRAGIDAGCRRAESPLPGGLQVMRRAPRLSRDLIGGALPENDCVLDTIRQRSYDFAQTMRWVSCFALAINEENAAMGRIVTAPTNGAAGVIPAVLAYADCFGGLALTDRQVQDFLLVAGEVASLFKKGATISAALGGCQAEIGVSSAMAAAALCEIQGGSVRQSLMAAEIAMEHHLGLTCDPVAGLVQIPCIERNAMGAIKAINATQLALAGEPRAAKVSLDDVIRTMAATARDMSSKYKETSQGGLATNISVAHPEC